MCLFWRDHVIWPKKTGLADDDFMKGYVALLAGFEVTCSNGCCVLIGPEVEALYVRHSPGHQVPAGYIQYSPNTDIYQKNPRDRQSEYVPFVLCLPTLLRRTSHWGPGSIDEGT